MQRLRVDAGWCWFQDERALVVDDRFVVFGSVADGRGDAMHAGDVEATVWDLQTGNVTSCELADRLDRDDHAAPAFVRLRDGDVLVAYATHGHDDVLRTRRGRLAGGELVFGPEKRITLPLQRGHGLCYSNLLWTGRDGAPVLVDLCRGENWNPTLLLSTDAGRTFALSHRLVGGPGRPYAKYASDGQTVHVVCTEQHPRDFDTGIWHGTFVGDGPLRCSDGSLAVVAAGARWPAPMALTNVFRGAPDAVAWPADLELDPHGAPVCVFSVQVDGARLPPGQGGLDHRLWYARADAGVWRAQEIAYAGRRLYAGEDDYTGLACIVPDAPDVVVLSTDVDPSTGAALVSAADGRQHHELFVGRVADGGRRWTWRPLTHDSTCDNLRPIVPRWRSDRAVVLWLAGSYRRYTDYELDACGVVVALDHDDVR